MKTSTPPAIFEEAWAALGDIPVDDDGLLAEPFLDFERGDDREAVWRWMERHYGVSVANKMTGRDPHEPGAKGMLPY